MFGGLDCLDHPGAAGTEPIAVHDDAFHPNDRYEVIFRAAKKSHVSANSQSKETAGSLSKIEY
jgi:hypothetical protein